MGGAWILFFGEQNNTPSHLTGTGLPMFLAPNPPPFVLKNPTSFTGTPNIVLTLSVTTPSK